jgi:hypothetical protein
MLKIFYERVKDCEPTIYFDHKVFITFITFLFIRGVKSLSLSFFCIHPMGRKSITPILISMQVFSCTILMLMRIPRPYMRRPYIILYTTLMSTTSILIIDININ